MNKELIANLKEKIKCLQDGVAVLEEADKFSVLSEDTPAGVYIGNYIGNNEKRLIVLSVDRCLIVFNRFGRQISSTPTVLLNTYTNLKPVNLGDLL